MDFSTEEGMDAHIYTYTRYNSKKMVYGDGNVHRTTSWDTLVQRFNVKFTFEHEYPLIDAVLRVIRTKIFSEEGSMEVVPVCSAHKASMIVHELLECYNVMK
jgi:hypothetical protein